jgi:hypothetical protein
VFETGSLEARVLQRLSDERKLVATAAIAQAMSESETDVAAALTRLEAAGELVEPVAGRWLVHARWDEAEAAIEREVRAFATKFPRATACRRAS